MTTPEDTTPPEPHRFSIRLPRRLWIFVPTAVLVVVGTAILQRAGLSHSERLLLGKWTFRTTDKTNRLRSFEFLADHMAALVVVDQSPAQPPYFYDWRIDGETLVLTQYVERSVGEPATRKIARAASGFQGMLQGRSLPGDSAERFKIVQRNPGILKLQAYSQAGQLLPDGLLTLVRVGEARTDDVVAHGE